MLRHKKYFLRNNEFGFIGKLLAFNELCLIGTIRISRFTDCNSGKQGTTEHTVVRLLIFRVAKTVQTACWVSAPKPHMNVPAGAAARPLDAGL